MNSITRRSVSSCLRSTLAISAVGIGAASLALALGGCEEKSATERAADNVADNVEKAGEKVEDAMDKAADAVRDATK